MERELIARTSLTEEEIGEYSGEKKEIRPVTIATYQVVTRKTKGEYRAPGAVRLARLGPGRLRRGPPAAGAGVPDDGGPAGPAAAGPDRDAGARGRPRRRRLLADRAEALRRAVADIEAQGWIAPADCTEVRVTLTDAERLEYATAEADERYQLAATALTKTAGDQVDRGEARGRADRW